MSQLISQPKRDSSDRSAEQVSRRKLFFGAGAVGAVAATASFLPSAGPAIAPEYPAKAAPAKGGGYHLSEHVKRYYRTTLV